MTRHVDALWPELEQLFSAGEAVEGLIFNEGWFRVLNVLEAEIATIDRQLDQGAPLTQAEYAKAHGRRGGLQAARDAAYAIVDRAEARKAEQQAKHEGAAESALGG